MLSTEIMKELLGLIKKTHGLPTALNEVMVKGYRQALSQYPAALVISVIEQVNLSWDKRYLPQPVVLINCCQERYDEAENEQEDEQLRRQEAAWKAKKVRHNAMLIDLCRRLKSNTLTEQQKEKVRIVDGYMKFHGDGWYRKVDYTDPKQKLSPVTASFIGLYMDLPKPLTGKKGGINILREDL